MATGSIKDAGRKVRTGAAGHIFKTLDRHFQQSRRPSCLNANNLQWPCHGSTSHSVSWHYLSWLHPSHHQEGSRQDHTDAWPAGSASSLYAMSAKHTAPGLLQRHEPKCIKEPDRISSQSEMRTARVGHGCSQAAAETRRLHIAGPRRPCNSTCKYQRATSSRTTGQSITAGEAEMPKILVASRPKMETFACEIRCGGLYSELQSACLCDRARGVLPARRHLSLPWGQCWKNVISRLTSRGLNTGVRLTPGFCYRIGI